MAWFIPAIASAATAVGSAAATAGTAIASGAGAAASGIGSALGTAGSALGSAAGAVGEGVMSGLGAAGEAITGGAGNLIESGISAGDGGLLESFSGPESGAAELPLGNAGASMLDIPSSFSKWGPDAAAGSVTPAQAGVQGWGQNAIMNPAPQPFSSVMDTFRQGVADSPIGTQIDSTINAINNFTGSNFSNVAPENFNPDPANNAVNAMAGGAGNIAGGGSTVNSLMGILGGGGGQPIKRSSMGPMAPLPQQQALMQQTMNPNAFGGYEPWRY